MSEKSYPADLTLRNGVKIPALILGSFQVADDATMLRMVDVAIGQGCYGFDTSPSYGSEKMLADALRTTARTHQLKREQLFISNKIDGWQMYQKNGEVSQFVDQSLENMKLDYFDLLLIHWPFPRYLENTWKCFEHLYRGGKTRAIGLCNTSSELLERFLESGSKEAPHIIQNEISPLRTCTEDVFNAKKWGITLEAYSPLCRMLPAITEAPALQALARKYKKSIAQIILRWHLDRGIIPVFSSKNPQRLSSNLEIGDFMLLPEEVDRINSMNQDYKIFPESFGCPGL